MQVARQRSIYKLLQARAALETLKIADQQWIQCSAQPRTMSLRQIQALIRDSPTAANQLFRSPTAGQVPQAADMVLLEHNTLAALVNMCSSLIGEHSAAHLRPLQTTLLHEAHAMQAMIHVKMQPQHVVCR